MNTYYLLPEGEYHAPQKQLDFASVTDSIVNDSHLSEYDRAVALQASLSKYLNVTKAGKGALEKEKIKALVLELLQDMQQVPPVPPPAPPPVPPPAPPSVQSPGPPSRTPFKSPAILGTFLSPPPPLAIHQYNTDDESDDPDKTVLPKRLAHTAAAAKIAQTAKRGGWISRD